MWYNLVHGIPESSSVKYHAHLVFPVLCPQDLAGSGIRPYLSGDCVALSTSACMLEGACLEKAFDVADPV